MRKEILVKEIDDLIKDLNITTKHKKGHLDYYYFVNVEVKAQIEGLKINDITIPIISLIIALFAIVLVQRVRFIHYPILLIQY